MTSSVECRAIAGAPNYPDLVITTASFPEALRDGFTLNLADWLGVNRSCVISYADLLALAKTGPRPPASTERTRPNVTDIPTWLASEEQLIRQALVLQLASPLPLPFGILDDQFVLPPWVERHPLFSLEFWQDDIKKKRFGLDEGWDELKIDVAAALSMTLDGFFISDVRREKAETLLEEQVQNYELPFSHSPDIGSITLAQLLRGGIRSACLFPLSAGIYLGANSLQAGQFLCGFEAVLAGGGMTICALSSLWVADKILKGIKNLRDDDLRSKRRTSTTQTRAG